MSEHNDTPAQSPVDEFDAAFDEATTDPTTAGATAPAPEVEEPVDEPTAEVNEGLPEAPAELTAGEAAANLEAESVSKPAEMEKPAEPTPPALDPKFLAQAIAEAQEQRAAASKPKEEEKPTARAVPSDFLSESDKTLVAKLNADWTDEAPAFEVLARAHAQAAVANAQADLRKELNAILVPLMQSTHKVEVDSHMSIIRAAHPDAESLVPDVESWIAKQPAFLQPSMQSILAGGTANDVVGLLNMFKEAKAGSGAAPETPAPTAPLALVAKPKAAVNPAAVAATAAVPPAQRTKTNVAADPNDWDSAFAEAVSELK